MRSAVLCMEKQKECLKVCLSPTKRYGTEQLDTFLNNKGFNIYWHRQCLGTHTLAHTLAHTHTITCAHTHIHTHTHAHTCFKVCLSTHHISKTTRVLIYTGTDCLGTHTHTHNHVHTHMYTCTHAHTRALRYACHLQNMEQKNSSHL